MADCENRIKIRQTPSPEAIKVSTASEPRNLVASNMANVYYLAKDWAIKMGDLVEHEDYSSKQWAAWSKVWAEGTDEEVAELGGTHSAKVWAESVYETIKEGIEAHDANKEAHPYIQGRITAETERAELAEQLLQQHIDETNEALQNYIELNNKAVADLDEKVDNINTTLTQQIADLDEKVDGINANLTQQISELEQDVNDKYNELTRDIDDLTDVVEEDFSTLNTKIDTSVTTINQRITDVADELNQTIEENVVALQQEDTALQNQINTHSQSISDLDTRVTANANAITQETSNRQTADVELQEQITDNTQAIADEAETRQIVDDSLQDQIDNLEARGHYLSTWDASTGLANTNPPKSPYIYRSGDFFIVGKVGETNYKPSGTQYVTGQASTAIETEELAVDDTYYYDGTIWHLQSNHGKTVSFANLAGVPNDNIALKNALDSKQPVIDDLATIRTNAQTGANLAPQVSTNATDIGDLKLNKADKSEVEDLAQASGSALDYTDTTLSLLNSSGDTLSSVTIKSTPDLDNTTMSLNDNSELQSIGSVLLSGGYQNYWCGTKAEYDLIETKDPNVLYEVLDEVNDIVTEIPTATVNDIGLVKPDGTTITIDDTGKISVSSTSLLNHNSSNGAHTELFAAKANINLNNVTAAYDWVTSRTNYGNGESGYEVTRNKRMTQWGKATSNANGEVEFTLHKPFKDLNFSIFGQPAELGNFFFSIYPSGTQKFKCRIQSAQGTNMAVKFMWIAYGYAP